MFWKHRLRFRLRLCVHFELWTFAWSARLWYDINQNSFPTPSLSMIYYALCTVRCTFDWDVVQTVSHICDSCHIACYRVGALQNHVTQVFGQNLLTSFWLFTPCALSLLCPLRPWSLFRPGPAWHIHWAWVQSAKTRKLELSALRWTIDSATAI